MTMLRMTKALRVAIYARYSSDIQNPASVADQVRLCRELVKTRLDAATVVRVCEDAAISGSTMDRPGLTALLTDVIDGRIDLVVAEGLDRISRNLSDMARIHNICRNANCRIFTSHEGEVSDLHVGFKGTMNALFLHDLKEKIRRGHESSVLDGRVAGSKAYGYRPVRGVMDERGRYQNGLREISEPEATVVRRIFQLVAEGVPVRTIVRILNDEGIPSPGGKEWGAPSIIGSRSRQAGILNNELYRGRIIWNRTKRIVDPRTGKARYEPNPASEYVISEVPELRIIDEELWQRAQAMRNKARAVDGKRGGRPRMNPDLGHAPGNRAFALTGLVRCGSCGGLKTLANAGRYVCDRHRKTHGCSNARGTREDVIAERLFPALISDLHAITDLKETVQSMVEEADRERRKREAEIEVLRGRVRRLIEMTELARVHVEAPAKRIGELETRIHELEDGSVTPALDLSEREMKDVLARALAEIAGHMTERHFTGPVRNALAKIVENVTLTPIPDSRSGEEIEFSFKVDGWAALYCHLFSFWPGVDRTEFEAR